MPKAMDMEMLTSPPQATEAAVMVTELQALLEAALEEPIKDMALPSTTSMMAMAVNKLTAAMEVALDVAPDAAQAKTMALAEPQPVSGVPSSSATTATAASNQTMAMATSNQTTAMAVSNPEANLEVDPSEMALVVVDAAKAPTTQTMALQMMAMVTLPKIAAMVKPRMMAMDSPRMMATVNLRTMATDNLRTMAMDNPRTMATDNPRTMATDNPRTMATNNPRTLATDNLISKPSTESEATLIKQKVKLRKVATVNLRIAAMVNLRTMATAKSMKATLDKLKIVEKDLSKKTRAVKECSKQIKLSRTAEHRETLVEPRWMDTNVHIKL